MDEELSMAMWKTIRSVFEDGETTLDKFVDAFIRERPDLLERYLIGSQSSSCGIFQSLLDVCVAKGDEELRARGWRRGKYERKTEKGRRQATAG